MKTNKQIKAWYARASQSDADYQLAGAAWQNAMDTFAEGDKHPDFWRVLDDSRQFLVDTGWKAKEF